MPEDLKPAGQWRRLLALVIAAALSLAVLVATRGPDRIGFATAETAGQWLLSGPSVWHPLAPLGAAAQALFSVAGPRGWQNAHVVIAWLALVCWLVGLPPRSWRGLLPVIPALIATILASSSSGLSGFGAAVLVLSLWKAFTLSSSHRFSVAALGPAAWVAVWLSSGALPLLLAFMVEASTRLPRKFIVAAAAIVLFVVNLTPRGTDIWTDARVFLIWSPQPALWVPGVIAVLASLIALALAARACWHNGQNGCALGPFFLLLCAMGGQTAFLWPAALMMVPCWPAAKEQLARWGIGVRWWFQATLVAATIALAAWPCFSSIPKWYDLVMTSSAFVPTLTHDAVPRDGAVFINAGGLPLARLAGRVPTSETAGLDPVLGREPGLWRAQDRKSRYRAVWLLGDKAGYAPLARHLGESSDWQLEAVDATGVMFVRKPRVGEFATEPAQQFARELAGAVNKSGFLSGSALACLAAGAIPEAGELSATAVKRSDRSSSTASTRTLVLISLGLIRQALDESLRAIQLDPNSAEAWRARTETLLHARAADDAYAAGRRAAELAPDDAGTLWLAARAANAARAFQTESLILEQLIALATGRGGDAGFYRFYLGQSYARQGLLRPALESLGKAAKAPGLSEDQRREIREEMENLTAPGAGG